MGAINNLTGLYEYPTIAVKTNVYSCPDCKKNVILKKGNIKIHHFAHHKSENPCSYYNNPGESQIHKDAKLLLKTLLENKRSICFKRNCDTCSETKLFNTIEYTDKSKTILEHPFKYNNSSKQADVALLNDNNIAYIFEICYKHKTLEENRPEPWFEIDAEALQKNKDILNTENTNIGIVCLRKYKCNKCIVREKTLEDERKRRLELEETEKKRRLELEKAERKRILDLEEAKRKRILESERIKKQISDEFEAKRKREKEMKKEDAKNKLAKLKEKYIKDEEETRKIDKIKEDYINSFSDEKKDMAHTILKNFIIDTKKQISLLHQCNRCGIKKCYLCNKKIIKEWDNVKPSLPTLQDILKQSFST